MGYIDILKPQLRVDEGIRAKPYKDTVGKLTIGVGRNLDDVGVSDDEIDLMLTNDILHAEHAARGVLNCFDNLSDVRKAVVVNMAFNMGQRVFSTFTNTLKAINEGRYDDAADGMLASHWAQQVGARAKRLADAMRQG
jgi:lysozyme